MSGKVVLVTGGAGGTGSAIVRAFAAGGFRVAVNYFQSKEKAEALKAGLTAAGAQAEIFYADVSQRAQAVKLCSDVVRKFGRIDVLVNNAGVSQTKLFTDITEADLDNIMRVNFNGAFFVTQEAVKDMLKRKSGNVINISSVWGRYGGSCETHYSASKAALDGLTKALAKELGPSGITVNSIACGLIDTVMNSELSAEDAEAFISGLAVQRIGKPEDVAALAFFLASGKCGYLTGQVISLDGGY